MVVKALAYYNAENALSSWVVVQLLRTLPPTQTRWLLGATAVASHHRHVYKQAKTSPYFLNASFRYGVGKRIWREDMNEVYTDGIVIMSMVYVYVSRLRLNVRAEKLALRGAFHRLRPLIMFLVVVYPPVTIEMRLCKLRVQ